MTLEFLDLLLGDTITRFVFFPSLAALPLLFLGRAGRANGQALCPVRRARRVRAHRPVRRHPLGRRHDGGARRHPELARLRLAQGALRGRRGRHFAAARPADRPPAAAGHSRLLERNHEALDRFRCVDAPPHHRHAGGARRARSARLLRLLGSHADPDVPDHRNLGRRPPGLRRGEVLHLHHGGKPAHAARHPLDGLELRRAHRRLELPLRGSAAAAVPARASSSGCSAPSPWRSRSRCRCSRSTPGCPTPTSRPPPAAR